MYAACGGNCDKNWIENVMGKPWQAIKWQIKWLCLSTSLLDTRRYTLCITFKYPESYNIQQPFGSGGANVTTFTARVLVWNMYSKSQEDFYTQSLAVNILQKVSLVCYIFKRLKMRKLKKNFQDENWMHKELEHICFMKIYSKCQTHCMCIVLGHQHQVK